MNILLFLEFESERQNDLETIKKFNATKRKELRKYLQGKSF